MIRKIKDFFTSKNEIKDEIQKEIPPVNPETEYYLKVCNYVDGKEKTIEKLLQRNYRKQQRIDIKLQRIDDIEVILLDIRGNQEDRNLKLEKMEKSLKDFIINTNKRMAEIENIMSNRIENDVITLLDKATLSKSRFDVALKEIQNYDRNRDNILNVFGQKLQAMENKMIEFIKGIENANTSG